MKLKVFVLAALLLIATVSFAPTALATATLTKVTNPSALPADTGQDVAWSPNGTYLAVASTGAIPLRVYTHSGTTFTAIDVSSCGPEGNSWDVAWSADGSLLAIVHTTTPYLTVCSVSGATFTELSAPATLPEGIGLGVCFSPSGGHLAVTHETTPFLSIYSISGTTLTSISNPASMPAAYGQDCEWSPNGQWLAVAASGSPRIRVYGQSGNTFTSVFTANPSGATVGNGLTWSANSIYLGFSHDGDRSPIYRSDIGWSEASDPSYGGDNEANDFTSGGNYYAVAHHNSPRITVSTFVGDTIGAGPSPDVNPTGTGNGVAWSPTDDFLAVAHAVSPFVTIYQASGFSPPQVPQNFVCSPGQTWVVLTWTNSSGATSYQLRRDGVLIASPSGSPYNDTGLATSTTYNYTLNATGEAGNSTGAGPISCSTTGPPGAPTLQGAYRECGIFAMNWTLPAGAPDSYNVTRTSPRGGNRSVLVPPSGWFAGRELNDTYPPVSTTFTYRVSAHNGGGWGAASGPVQFTPPNLTSVGECGLLWGSGGQAVLAEEAGVSPTALGLIVGIVFVAMMAGFGAAMNGAAGAGAGAGAGVLLSIGFQVLPLWVNLFLVMTTVAGFLFSGVASKTRRLIR